MRIHFVRHGQTSANAEGRVEGQTGDSGLTTLGREQAMQAARQLAALQVRGPVFSSDLRRAAETAELIAERLGTDVWFDDRAREQYYGAMEGRLRAELQPEPTPAGVHITEVNWAGGESVAQLYLRVRELLGDLIAWAKDADLDDIVLVTHSGPIQVALVALAELAPGHQGCEHPHRQVQWVSIRNGEVVTQTV